MTASDAQTRPTPIIVSACLLGLPTRYNAAHCRRDAVVALSADHVLVPACPEQLGGLPTPRQAAEIKAGDGEDVLDGRSRVEDASGADVTAQFIRGAEAVAALAGLYGARRALLKEGSPSCGVLYIGRAGANVPGAGVTTALLRRRGIRVDGIE